jgi:hypothetical protein
MKGKLGVVRKSCNLSVERIKKRRKREKRRGKGRRMNRISLTFQIS